MMKTKRKKVKVGKPAKSPVPKENPSTPETDASRYSKAIVTFVDILGFRKLVEETEVDGVLKMLSSLRSQEEWELKIFGDKMYPTEYTYFSDTIVRTTRVDDLKKLVIPVGAVFQEILDVLHMQIQATYAGYFLRGGITVGDLYQDGSVLFGPALIRSYDLESKIAIYPRIVIDPEVIKLVKEDIWLRSDQHTIDEEMTYIMGLLAEMGDGVPFVNYLDSISEFDPPEGHMDFMKLHKDAILSQARLSNSIDNISAKYLWLAQYHNRIAMNTDEETYTAYGHSRDDLMVSENDLAYSLHHPDLRA